MYKPIIPNIKPNINNLNNISILESISTFQKLIPLFSGTFDIPDIESWIIPIEEGLSLYLKDLPTSVKVSTIKTYLTDKAKFIISNRIFLSIKDFYYSLRLSFPRAIYKLEMDNNLLSGLLFKNYKATEILSKVEETFIALEKTEVVIIQLL